MSNVLSGNSARYARKKQQRRSSGSRTMLLGTGRFFSFVVIRAPQPLQRRYCLGCNHTPAIAADNGRGLEVRLSLIRSALAAVRSKFGTKASRSLGAQRGRIVTVVDTIAERGTPMPKCLGAVIIAALCFTGCHGAQGTRQPAAGIIGAWVVEIPGAPFPVHMFVFHSDGTVVQSNPDAGDPNTSDSSLMGAWRTEGDGYKGKLVEVTADRNTHRFASRGEISFAVKVSGNKFSGTASAAFFDPSGRQITGTIEVTMMGERVMP